MKTFAALIALSAVASIACASETNSTSRSLLNCKPWEANAIDYFFDNAWSDGPYYECKVDENSNKWGMIKAYRAGGTEGVHWKYTDNDNDPDCMYGWTYYKENGEDLKAYVAARTTTVDSNRKWCATRVYRRGGKQGKQWDYCVCHGR